MLGRRPLKIVNGGAPNIAVILERISKPYISFLRTGVKSLFVKIRTEIRTVRHFYVVQDVHS